MKHIVVALAALMGCAVIATPAGMPNGLTGNEKAEGWKLLFDGKSLDQWDLSTSPTAQWKAVDGAIVTDSKQGGTLLSKEDFANFELKVEFRTTDNVNSGVMLRNPRPDASKKKGGGGQGYEVQIRDKDAGHYTGGSYLTGSLVNVEKAPADVKIVSGESMALDITAEGDHFVILYNGRKVVDAHDTKLENGAIGLQWAHPEDAPGTQVEFRNIKVRRLK
jgi:hypothetical protein